MHYSTVRPPMIILSHPLIDKNKGHEAGVKRQ